MKRSEALTIIKTLIEVNIETLYQIPDASLVSELILYTLENKGMLPPQSSEGLNDDFGNEICGPSYEWEPEDG